MARMLLHEVLRDGTVRHSEFTSPNSQWNASMRDPAVVRREAHRASELCNTPPPALSGPPVVLVDGMNLLFRSHYALRNLSTRDGIPTGTYHGMLTTLHRLISKIGWRIVFCWDNGLPAGGTSTRVPNWRRAVLPTYKATRRPSADSTIVFQQIPEILRVLHILGFACIGIPGLEADDVIGILVGENPRERFEILSSDRDLYQLLSNNTRVLKPGRADGGDWERMTSQDVEAEYEVPISRWAVYLALGGDSSDNLRPIAGMGPMTAKELVARGIEPTRAFADNPSSVSSSRWGAKLQSHWKAVQAAHVVADIPRRLRDPRIAAHTHCIRAVSISSYQGPASTDVAGRLHRFTQFCADYDLQVILSKRREFFKPPPKESREPST